MLAEEATRETFANLPVWAIAFWYFLIFVSTGILFYGIYRLARKYRQGRGPAEVDRPARRAGDAEDRPLALLDPAARPALGVRAPVRLLRLHGAVRRDGDPRCPGRSARPARIRVLERLVLQGLFALPRCLRRCADRRPDRARREARDHPTLPGSTTGVRTDADETDRSRYVLGDWLFLGLLFFLALSGFLLEAFRIAETDPSFEVWSPIGWIVGQGFRTIGFDDGAALMAHRVDWWVHGIVALAFVASIPFTKAVHMIAGPAGVAVKDDKAGRRLVPLPGERQVRRSRLPADHRSAPRHLLDLDACTKCGSATTPARRPRPGIRSRRAT